MKRNRFFLLFLVLSISFASCTKEIYDVQFPIEFTSHSGLPKTKVNIEGISYSLMFDLGSSSLLSLNKIVLEKIIQKHKLKTTHIFDIKGNKYETPVYLIPEIKIGRMRIAKIDVDEEDDNFLSKGSILTHSPGNTEKDIIKEKLGRIGRGLFENNTNLFLDFHNSVIYGCNSINNRKKEGYKINQMIQVPFELNRKLGIILNVDTDLGIRRFALDTGASRSLIRSSLLKDQTFCKEWKGLRVYKSSKFAFGSKDFGSQELLFIEIAPVFENLDGIIGMDFLKNHVVYLDFKKKIAYIGKASECF